MLPQDADLIKTLRAAGFKGRALRVAYGIVRRESGGRADAHNPNRATGDDSYGMFQINMLGGMGPARRRQFGIRSNQELFDPAVNARAAFQLSRGGRDFGAWGIGPNAYRQGVGIDTISRYMNEIPQQPQVSAPPAGPAQTGPDRQGFALELLNRSRERRGASPLSAALVEGLRNAGGARNAPAARQPAEQDVAASLSGGPYPVSFFKNGYTPLGAPHQGTHTLGNYESDNAWDYGAAPGTSIFSPFSGVVKAIKPGAASGRFGGYSVRIGGTPYGDVYLKHLDPRIRLKVGQRVTPGMMLALVGNISGLSPHLHAGFEHLPS